MPSGKQLSFINGEISQALRFKTDSVTYAQGLSVLLGGYVRKAGGVSNRPGMKYIANNPYQNNLPKPGSYPGVRIFGFIGEDGRRYIVTQAYSNGILTLIKIIAIVDGTVYEPVTGVSAISGTDLLGMRATRYGDKLILQSGNGTLAVVVATSWAIPQFEIQKLKSPTPVGAPANPGVLTTTGLAPLTIPTTYLITQELMDGSEVFWGAAAYAAGHPHAQAHSLFSVAVDITAEVKHYNVYRGSGGQYTETHMYLVGRISARGASPKVFNDFISNPDITLQPPLDRRLYGAQIGAPAVTAQHFIEAARFIDHYQQRRCIVYKTSDTDFAKGTIGVSKLGTPDMMDAPLTPNPIDAFQFTKPITSKGEIVAILPMERLIVFTEKEAVVIRGGEEGVLTPQTVNPYIVSREGCSAIVAPIAVGTRGYYINWDHTKLIGFEFGENNAIDVQEISLLSDHMLELRNVVAIEMTSGPENILWLLKNDGKLISVTITSDLVVTGWARHETDGYIEAITSMSQPAETLELYLAKPAAIYDTLYLSVIREGVRTLEYLAPRNDTDPQKFNYADCSTDFGQRLVYIADGEDYANPLLNIEGGTTWGPEETLTIRNIPSGDDWHPDTSGGGEPGYLAFDAGIVGTKKIDFFYDEESEPDGEIVTKRIRFTITAYISGVEIEGFFDGPVPLSLQDAEASITAFKKKRQSRWLPAIASVTGLTHLALEQVSVFADGQVVSSPNNPKLDDYLLTVSAGGTLTLPEYFNYGVVGLPYNFEAQTLDLDTADERTFTDAMKLVNSLGIALHETRGGFYGQTNAEMIDMSEAEFRENEVIEEPTANRNGHVFIPIKAEWEKTGRVKIKQVDPLPITVLAVYPKGLVGD